MPKIIDIKYVSGRRQEVIDGENEQKIIKAKILEPLIKLARIRYAKWVNDSPHYHTNEIEVWVNESYNSLFHGIFEKPVFPSRYRNNLIDELKKDGVSVPKDYLMNPSTDLPEISLEERIITMLEDGWELYG